MTVSRAYSATIVGLEGKTVVVETAIGAGLPALTIVGLPDAAVKESRDRAPHGARSAALFPGARGAGHRARRGHGRFGGGGTSRGTPRPGARGRGRAQRPDERSSRRRQDDARAPAARPLAAALARG